MNCAPNCYKITLLLKLNWLNGKNLKKFLLFSFLTAECHFHKIVKNRFFGKLKRKCSSTKSKIPPTHSAKIKTKNLNAPMQHDKTYKHTYLFPISRIETEIVITVATATTATTTTMLRNNKQQRYNNPWLQTVNDWSLLNTSIKCALFVSEAFTTHWRQQ